MSVTTETRGNPAAKYVWIAAAVLFVLHQDFWYWADATLVFGFMPIGLAYHALYSIVAACLWACAVKLAWPRHVEEWAEADDQQEPAP